MKKHLNVSFSWKQQFQRYSPPKLPGMSLMRRFRFSYVMIQDIFKVFPVGSANSLVSQTDTWGKWLHEGTWIGENNEGSKDLQNL